MKKKLIIAVALFLSIATVTPALGQGFFEKLSKGIDSVNKELDKFADKSSSTAKSSRNNLPETANKGNNLAYNSVLVKSFSPKVEIVLESCIRYGNKVVITYYATNNGEEVVFDRLGVSKNIINKTEETKIIGDNGESFPMRYYTVGSDSESSMRTTFPSEVRIKGTLEIYGVSASAKQFQLVNIAGLKFATSGNSQFIPLSFSFRNVPIYTQQQVIGMMNAKSLLTVEEPFVELYPDENYKVESVEFTDKYTRVDLSYKNDRYSPVGYLTLNQPEVCILANDITYPLIGYWGVTPRKDDYTIKYHDTGRYTYIFEPVPSDIVSFDLVSDDIKGITVKSNINIPKTKGMFQSLDVYSNAFYKHTRMTQADRARYKIDKIKHENLQRPLLNKHLAKGKLIYKCDKGRLETFLYIIPDNLTDEYLVSYDNNGNVIDCINIGAISAYGGDRGYAVFAGDKISVYSSYPSDDGDIVNSVDEYKVSDNLKFIEKKK